MILGPDHTCHCCANWEFIANCFLLSPVEPDFIDENNIVTLSNSDFLRIRRKFQSSYQVTLLSFVRRLGWEFIFSLSILIKKIDGLNKKKSTLSAAPTANFLPEGAQVIAETFFMLSSKGMTLAAYLSFI